MTTREQLETVWRTSTRDVERFAGESGLSTVPSERWNQVNDGIEELAVMLIEETSGSDDSGLDELMHRIWTDIERQCLDWAEQVVLTRNEQSGIAA